MADSQPPWGDDFDAQSRRLTPSIDLAPAPSRSLKASEAPAATDASNEDFLFHLYRGSELLQDNRVHEAKEELERALILQPRDAQGQDLIAVVYFRLGMYTRAITIFEQLRKKAPRDTALLLNLALCYLKVGQPSNARVALEELLQINPTHVRAWGYLGLACERTGDLAMAERAFQQGGHEQMARRIADRRSAPPGQAPPPELEPAAALDVLEPREVVATAFKELDAGQLSFEAAEPTRDSVREPTESSWQAIELGSTPSSSRRPEIRSETAHPDTKDGPPPAFPHLATGTAANRRPTLIAAGVPGLPKMESGVPGFGKIPTAKPLPFAVDEAGVPSLRRPLVAVPPVRLPYTSVQPPPEPRDRTKTLPPPLGRAASLPPPPFAELAEESAVDFPTSNGLVLHPSGVALVRTAAAANAQPANATAPAGGFAARLESVRASSNGLAMKLLERQTKGKPTGESFGGVASPMVHAAGEGLLVLAPRPGRKLSSFGLEDEMCFVREEVLLGFDGELAYENGRLATGEGEFVSIVQLRGRGAVLVEAIGEVLTLEVQANRGISVRREVVLGWFGRLVPRALAPSEAPCGQRGLVSFAGEGRVLVASA